MRKTIRRFTFLFIVSFCVMAIFCCYRIYNNNCKYQLIISDTNISVSYTPVESILYDKLSYEKLLDIYQKNTAFLDRDDIDVNQKDVFILERIEDSENYDIVNSSIIDSMYDQFDGFYKQLTDAEKTFIIKHPFLSTKMFLDAMTARDNTHLFYTNENRYSQDNADAFRHSYWNALMTKHVGVEYAKEFADIHEENPNSQGIDKEMDLYNNEQGRNLGIEFQNLEDDELAKKVLSRVSFGHMKRIVNDALVSTTREGLIIEYVYDYTNLDDSSVRINDVLLEIEGSFSLDSEINGKDVVELGQRAFSNQKEMLFCTLPDTINDIGSECFIGCEKLARVYANNTNVTILKNRAFYAGKNYIVCLPNGIEMIGENALEGTFPRKSNLSVIDISDVVYVGKEAFKDADIARMEIPSTIVRIGDRAFQNSNPDRVLCLSDKVEVIGDSAFSMTDLSCIYVEYSSKPSRWSNSWNSSNYPVIWDTKFSSDKSYIKYVSKSANSIQNIDSSTKIPNPTRRGYSFEGWYAAPDFSGDAYYDILKAPNGMLHAKWVEKSSDSCITEGSLITLADGTKTAVENLTGDEELLVWDMLNGTFTSAPILFIDSEETTTYDVITLTFSDGTQVEVIDEHAFFDTTLNKYVFLRNDASQYIGHYFKKQSYDLNNNMILSDVQLLDVTITQQVTTAYSPVTYGHLCYYVNGMLSMPGNTESFINIFDVDSTTMSYDQASMAQDISIYGLYTYEEFNNIIPIPEFIFDAFNGQYLKIAIGKGATTPEKIYNLIYKYIRYLAFSVE